METILKKTPSHGVTKKILIMHATMKPINGDTGNWQKCAVVFDQKPWPQTTTSGSENLKSK